MRTWIALGLLAFAAPTFGAEPLGTTHFMGHRGLFLHSPEGTLPNYAACVELRIDFELDVRKTRDGRLVCLHDPTVDRTTNGKGAIADLNFHEIRELNAGAKFDPAFSGTRIPALREVFELVKARRSGVFIAIDLKTADDGIETDIVHLAQQSGVLRQSIFIGRTITNADVRKKLRAASPDAAPAILCESADKLQDAIADPDSLWVYVRFLPTADEVKKVHAAGKRVYIAGPLVQNREPANWARARDAGVDMVLTNFPLEARAAARNAAP